MQFLEEIKARNVKLAGHVARMRVMRNLYRPKFFSKTSRILATPVWVGGKGEVDPVICFFN